MAALLHPPQHAPPADRWRIQIVRHRGGGCAPQERSAARRYKVMSKIEASFDPDSAATGDRLFGLSTSIESAALVVIPIPFDATTSFRAGTAAGPAALSKRARSAVEPIIRAGGAVEGNRVHARALATVNDASAQVHRHVA